MKLRKPVVYIKNTTCFSEKNFAKLEKMMHEQKVPVGSPLFSEGDAANKWFYIRKGCVKITKSSKGGKELILYLFHEGDLIGQMDHYRDSRQSFQASALEECTVGILHQRDLDFLLCQHGPLAGEFMKWMGLMHRMTQTKFRDLMMYGKSGALCSTLIRLSNTYGRKSESGILISKKFTHTELADYIGAARESVNRMLGHLKTAGVIDWDDGHITILNMDYLREGCHCENCPNEICRI